MNVIAKRKVDEIGRVVLPIKLRSDLSIEFGDELEIGTEENGNIILQKAKTRCTLCNGTDKLTKVMDRYICASCREIISKTE